MLADYTYNPYLRHHGDRQGIIPNPSNMFENYPKKRTELPEKYKVIYNEHYKTNREGNTNAASLAQMMETWLHRKVAADVEKNHTKRTLEIGAGTLNQLKYEQSNHYDIVEPFSELYLDSPFLPKIGKIYTDIDEVDLSQRYDRITSVATFEHITDLPKVIAKSCLLLDLNGSLRTSIPNEGTFLWTLGWKMTTGLEFRLKYGLDYGTLMKHEHVNNAREIEALLNYFFDQNRCSTYGLNKKIAFYRFYESTGPRVEQAKQYLETLADREKASS